VVFGLRKAFFLYIISTARPTPILLRPLSLDCAFLLTISSLLAATSAFVSRSFLVPQAPDRPRPAITPALLPRAPFRGSSREDHERERERERERQRDIVRENGS